VGDPILRPNRSAAGPSTAARAVVPRFGIAPGSVADERVSDATIEASARAAERTEVCPRENHTRMEMGNFVAVPFPKRGDDWDSERAKKPQRPRRAAYHGTGT
jgi:hypothetical protein